MKGWVRAVGLMITCLLAASPGGAASAATPWTQTLTQQALSSGFLTRLPPTVSVAFGLPKAEEGTDVRQLLTKDGHRIRTFNVSVAKHDEVVIFNVDAQSGATVAYLVAPDGQLRKALTYRAGSEARPLAEADARAGFAHETRFWSGRARRVQPPPTPAAPPSH